MKTACEIIRDLLPLYHDGVCSEESRLLVEEHLAECEGCRRVREKITPAVTETKEAESLRSLKSIGKEWIRRKKMALIKGIFAGVAACLVTASAAFGLTGWKIVPVATEKMKVTEICLLSEGQLAFHLYVDDEYQLHEVAVTVTEEGVMYITPRRSLIEAKRDPDFDEGLYNQEYMVDLLAEKGDNGFSEFSFTSGVALKAVRLGTEKDNILLWQTGMELPLATEHQEALYTDPYSNSQGWGLPDETN